MKQALHQVQFYLLLLIAFLMPLHQLFIPLLLALTIILWLIEGNFREKYKNTRSPWLLAAILLFYIYHVIGLIWTEDVVDGLFQLEVKLSFLLLPLFFSGIVLKSRERKKIVFALIAGCILAVGINFIHAAYQYITFRPWLEHFIGARFSWLMHLGYFAMYLNFAIAILFVEWIRSKKSKEKTVLMILQLVLIVAVFLTSSKIGILILVTEILIFFSYYIYFTKKYKTGIIAITTLVISLIALSIVFPSIPQRFVLALRDFNEEQIDKKTVSSTELRIIAWDASFSLIKENFWLGTGTGSLNSQLQSYYDQYDYVKAEQLKLNSHNQYLQTFATLGVMGFVLLIAIFVLAIYYSVKNADYLAMILALIFIITALTESVFQTQAGVLFFNFFISLLLFSKVREYEEE